MFNIKEKNKKKDPAKVSVPGNCNVLIVEDDVDEQRFAKKALLRLGYHPYITDNYLRALNALNQVRFKFVLTDLHYPCCSGKNISVKEQGQPQPNGITLSIEVKTKGIKTAILTNEYHHGSVEWASNLCSELDIPFLDTEPEWNTPPEEKGRKKWREAIERLKNKPEAILQLIERFKQ